MAVKRRGRLRYILVLSLLFYRWLNLVVCKSDKADLHCKSILCFDHSMLYCRSSAAVLSRVGCYRNYSRK